MPRRRPQYAWMEPIVGGKVQKSAQIALPQGEGFVGAVLGQGDVQIRESRQWGQPSNWFS